MPDDYDAPEGFDDPSLDEAEIHVEDHLEKAPADQCGYCGQHFGPDEVTIEREIYGRTWRFCSEECYRDFRDASDFRDQDLDGYQDDLSVSVNQEKDEDE